MTYPYTPTAVSPRPADRTGFPVSAPPPFGAPIPLPPAPDRREGQQSRRGPVVAAVIAACVAVFIAGIVGVYVGNRTATRDQPTVQAAPAASASAPTPTAEQVRAATVDLCTRFAAGYRAMPSPQNTSFDVVPSANYIADALRDNPVADPAIRDAVTKSLALLRDHAAALSREPSAGAIHIPQDFRAAPANAADQRTWDLCRAYDG